MEYLKSIIGSIKLPKSTEEMHTCHTSYNVKQLCFILLPHADVDFVVASVESDTRP